MGSLLRLTPPNQPGVQQGKIHRLSIILAEITPLNESGVQQEKIHRLPIILGDNIPNPIWIWNSIQIISGMFLGLCIPPGERNSKTTLCQGSRRYRPLHRCIWLGRNISLALCLSNNCSSSGGGYERPVGNAVIQKCLAEKGANKSCISFFFFS